MVGIGRFFILHMLIGGLRLRTRRQDKGNDTGYMDMIVIRFQNSEFFCFPVGRFAMYFDSIKI